MKKITVSVGVLSLLAGCSGSDLPKASVDEQFAFEGRLEGCQTHTKDMKDLEGCVGINTAYAKCRIDSIKKADKKKMSDAEKGKLLHEETEECKKEHVTKK